jgi:hypothetical protein
MKADDVREGTLTAAEVSLGESKVPSGCHDVVILPFHAETFGCGLQTEPAGRIPVRYC